ncbi:response regulator [Massilia sp. LXY-6]|uniref:response regulator transcription factor n=1 Tax=Massilia sp. LXY-6 TaxID=3379823 RepID=UPI003EDFB8CF
MIRTLVVEESGVARLGIRSLLDRHAHSLEIDEASSRVEVITKLCERYYELIIVEPDMAGGTGLSLVRQLRENSPWSDLLVFTALDELSFGVDAIRNGAKGYLMKTCTGEQFGKAVKRVAGGQVYLSTALAAEFATGVRRYDTRNKPHQTFSKREFQVFSMAVCGMTPIESAHLLQMSTETIGAFRRSVMDKLNVATPHGMAQYAAAQGLLDDCRATCSRLWAGRFGQDCVARPARWRSTFA